MKSSSRPRSRSSRAGRGLRALALALGFAWGSANTALAQSADGEGYAVVVSADVKVSNVSRADAVRLLLGQKRFWPSGLRVVVLTPAPGSSERRYLLNRLCRMTEAAYRRHTLEQLYRGEIEYAPKVIDDEHDALEFVSAGHGAVSIVSVHAARESRANILRIDGHLPGEPGYPLAP
jgi:hypothetical protein